MAQIRAIGTAVPTYVYTQDQVIDLAKHIFSSVSHFERYLPVYSNTGIQKRHFCVPPEWFLENKSFAEKNKRYQEEVLTLCEQAIQNCLQQANCTFNDLDHLIFVSSTGVSTPSIDAHILHQLPFSPHTKRTPIWGLGCAGGAVGLSRASEYVKAYPTQSVLLVCVELCGLTFLHNDRSKSNIIATSLFADGAAAVFVSGEQNVTDEVHVRPKIIDSMSTIFPQSLDVMGWELHDEGLKVVFSRDIPAIVTEVAENNLKEFLSKHHLQIDEIEHFILHPGGKKVLDAYEAALGIGHEKLQPAREVIAQYGNMSSATILFELERFLDVAKKGEYGVVGALGPGFSSEWLLLQW